MTDHTEPEPEPLTIHLLSADLLDACETAELGSLLLTPVRAHVTCSACRALPAPDSVRPLPDPAPAPTGEASGAVKTADKQRPLPEWSAELQLRRVLGQPALARVVGELCGNRNTFLLAMAVDAAVRRGVDERAAQQTSTVNAAVASTLSRLAAAADEKRKAATSERFTGHSRLS